MAHRIGKIKNVTIAPLFRWGDGNRTSCKMTFAQMGMDDAAQYLQKIINAELTKGSQPAEALTENSSSEIVNVTKMVAALSRRFPICDGSNFEEHAVLLEVIISALSNGDIIRSLDLAIKLGGVTSWNISKANLLKVKRASESLNASKNSRNQKSKIECAEKFFKRLTDSGKSPAEAAVLTGVEFNVNKSTIYRWFPSKFPKRRAKEIGIKS